MGRRTNGQPGRRAIEGQQLRAVIYCRISLDRYGEAEGVDRQEEAGRKVCADRGMDVVAVLVDNDQSALTGRRPAYRQLLDMVRRGQVDVIVCSRSDRLWRKRADLPELIDVLNRADVPVFTAHGGDLDLSTAEGRFQADLFGALATREVAVMGERISSQAEQRAHRGRFSGGARRFGYEQLGRTTRRVRDRVTGEYTDRQVPTGPLTLVPAEVDAIAWAYQAVCSGATLEAVARQWRARGLVGPKGAGITAVAVRDVLLRPLNAGIATYRGTELPDATPEAPAIVDQDTFRTVKAILSDPSRRTTSGRPVSTLLSSVLRCGVCGGRMSSGTRVKRLASGERTVVQLYRCASRGPDGEGSRGHVTRPRAKLDPAVEQLMVAWLMRNAEQLRRPASELSGKLAEQAAQAEALHAKLGAFQAQAAEMDPVDYAAATRAIRAKLAALDQQRIRAIGRPATESVLRAADIPKAWAGMSVDDRRAVVVENISAITVGPGVPGRRDQTMHAVTVDWREL